MDQIELIIYYTWNHLTVCKQMINAKLNYWCYLESFNCKQMNNVEIELLVLDNSTWSNLIVWKQISSCSFKNKVTYKLFVYKYKGFDIK